MTDYSKADLAEVFEGFKTRLIAIEKFLGIKGTGGVKKPYQRLTDDQVEKLKKELLKMIEQAKTEGISTISGLIRWLGEMKTEDELAQSISRLPKSRIDQALTLLRNDGTLSEAEYQHCLGILAGKESIDHTGQILYVLPTGELVQEKEVVKKGIKDWEDIE